MNVNVLTFHHWVHKDRTYRVNITLHVIPDCVHIQRKSYSHKSGCKVFLVFTVHISRVITVLILTFQVSFKLFFFKLFNPQKSSCCVQVSTTCNDIFLPRLTKWEVGALAQAQVVPAVSKTWLVAVCLNKGLWQINWCIFWTITKRYLLTTL